MTDSSFQYQLMLRALESRELAPGAVPTMSDILRAVLKLQAAKEARCIERIQTAALDMAALALRIGVETPEQGRPGA